MKEKAPKIEKAVGGEAPYDGELVRRLALERADEILAERLSSIETPTTEDKINALLAMMAEYGATVDGTNVPVNNDNRHVVEAIAHRLRTTEALHQLELLQGPTST